MNTRTANFLTTGLLALGAIGALALVAIADAKAPVQVSHGVVRTVVQLPKTPESCNKQAVSVQLVKYLGLSDRVQVAVLNLDPGVVGQSHGGLITIDVEAPCASLPRVIAHELGHELDRTTGPEFEAETARQKERTAECLADRAFHRIYDQDLNPVRCTAAETARAARLAPEWEIITQDGGL